jgi:hypothetical protein
VDLPDWWASLVGPDLPTVPDGWQRVDPGSPLLIDDAGEEMRLQFCPLCGPSVEFPVASDPGPGRRTRREHHLFGEHRPEQYGLSPLREGDRGLDEFEEVR